MDLPEDYTYAQYHNDYKKRLISFLHKQQFPNELCQSCFFGFYYKLGHVVTNEKLLYDEPFYTRALLAYKRLLALYRKTRKCNISLDPKNRYCKTFYSELEAAVGNKDHLNFVYPLVFGVLLSQMTEDWADCGDVQSSSLHPEASYFK